MGERLEVKFSKGEGSNSNNRPTILVIREAIVEPYDIRMTPRCPPQHFNLGLDAVFASLDFVDGQDLERERLPRLDLRNRQTINQTTIDRQ